MKYIVVSHVKKLAKQYDRRVGADFLLLLDAFVAEKVKRACETHNGGKVTMDATVAGWIGLNPTKTKGWRE